MKKYNLVVVDRQPEVENFTYEGVNGQNKSALMEQIRNNEQNFLHFTYDEGEAFVFKDTIHSLIFTDYVKQEDLEAPEPEDE